MTLHMVQMRCDAPELYRRVARDDHRADLGYAMHTHLRELFGEYAPHPFRVTEARGRDVTLLGYCERDAEELAKLAMSLGWTDLRSKPMPSIEPGRRLRFEARVCPTRRGRHTGPHARKRKGVREVDAFIAECWRRPEEPVDREAVYATWLRERFERDGVARVEGVRMERFERARLYRRRQGGERKGVVVERPDVVLSGVVEVRDGPAFGELLARGVGRHRAFGFGMVLLKATRC